MNQIFIDLPGFVSESQIHTGYWSMVDEQCEVGNLSNVVEFKPHSALGGRENLMKSIFCILLVAVSVGLAFAQDSPDAPVEGAIKHSDGRKAAGVELIAVCAADQTLKTGTDDQGNYSLVLPVGNCRFKVDEKDGDKTRTYELGTHRVLSEGINTINFELPVLSSIREHVDIHISTGTTQPFASVSKTTDVIDGGEIRDRNENNLIDAIRTIPGFRVQQLGGFGRTANIKTRGLRNQDTAVLVDGQRFRDPSSITGDASAFLSDIGTLNIERVEVLRGSGSSVYGTNAIGGVIDVQSRRAGSGFAGDFLSEYGGLGYSRFGGSSSYGTNDGRFGITGGLSRTGVTRGIDAEDDANNTSVRARVDANPVGRLNISGKFYLSDAFSRLNTNPDTFGTLPTTGVIDAKNGVNFVTDQNDPDNFQRSDFFSGQINSSVVINSKTVFSASYQGLKTKRENENGGLGPGFQPFGGTQSSFFDGQIHTFNTKLDWSPIRSGRVVAGYEFELEKYGNTGFGPTPADAFSTNVDQSSNTFFAQYLSGFLNNRLQFAGGVRLQSFSLKTPVFSISNPPYAGLSLSSPPSAVTFDGAVAYYFASTKTKIRTHIGNGYRVPSLYERFGSFYSSFSQAFFALGDPNLEPERSIAFDAGIDQSFMKDRVSLSATYFYTRLTDTIGYGNVVPAIGTTSRPFGGYENTKGGIARGAEFGASVKPSETTDLFVSYTFTNSDQRQPQVSGSGIIRTLGIPSQQFTLNATQQIGRRFSINFDFEASSSYLAPIFSNTAFSTYIYRFAGNRKGDLTARYDIPLFGEKTAASVFATVENLFGYTYFENGFATAGRTARAGLSFRF